MIIILIIAIALLVILKQKDTKETTTPPKTQTFSDPDIEQGLAETDKILQDLQYIRTAYNPKWMFTQNEKRAYYQLNEIAQRFDYTVFAKVRLFDLVEPRRNHQKYKTNLWKIQAKHVDFVLTKSNLVAKYIIELDDSSHSAPDRKERDMFVDNVLTACGYKVLRTREIKEDEIIKFINS